MSEIKQICEAMAKAWGEMQSVAMDRTNPHFKSKYATIDAVLDVARPALSKYGLWISQVLDNAERGITVTTRLFHASGEFMDLGQITMPVSKNDAQGVGSAITYGRRYSLLAALCMSWGEDDDGNAAAASPPPRDKPPFKQQPAKQDDAPPALLGSKAAGKMVLAFAEVGVGIEQLREIVAAKKPDHPALSKPPAEWPESWREGLTTVLKTLQARKKAEAAVEDAVPTEEHVAPAVDDGDPY